ncbi:hypothetical protein R7M47_05205 [Bacillus inaquosorum]|uniref:hypothetical protein n=1 Tax=Bacillus inaquosorum TaxID=483913 RepID=UPI00389ADA92
MMITLEGENGNITIKASAVLAVEEADGGCTVYLSNTSNGDVLYFKVKDTHSDIKRKLEWELAKI